MTHPAVEVLGAMVREGAIQAWRRPPGTHEGVFQIQLGPLGLEVRLSPWMGVLGEPKDHIARDIRMTLDVAARQLAAAVHKLLHTCADQPAAECTTAPPREVPELFNMPLPKGYRWPMTRFLGRYKPGPSLQISMLGLYSVARDAYRRSGSMRRVKRDLVALNIALAFDQRLNDADLYAVREVSADRVKSRIRGLCTWRGDWSNAPDLCEGRRRGRLLWDGLGPLCWPVYERGMRSYIGMSPRGGIAWPKLTVS